MKAPAKLKSSPKAEKKPQVRWNQFMTPLDDRVVVEVEIVSEITASGLYIPGGLDSTAGTCRGHVVLVGHGHKDKRGKLHNLDVQVGDKVIYPKYSGSETELNGVSVVFLRESEILGVEL